MASRWLYRQDSRATVPSVQRHAGSVSAGSAGGHIRCRAMRSVGKEEARCIHRSDGAVTEHTPYLNLKPNDLPDKHPGTSAPLACRRNVKTRYASPNTPHSALLLKQSVPPSHTSPHLPSLLSSTFLSVGRYCCSSTIPFIARVHCLVAILYLQRVDDS